MGKVLAIIPTFGLMMTLIYGLALTLNDQNGGESWLVYSIVGLGVYAFFVLAMGTLVKAANGEQHVYGRDEQLYFGYFVVILALVVLVSIYFMAHN
ncbi:LasU family protein [Lactiplantibacillus fabifermentans]|uniref:Uncharacterized protein n=2 Tax=Lactiplantibacillus fabifermentans TaxID=483011 RepID=A0A0R2NQ03_9LACO|nr:LasU family protein [Lactiplantibacillus fabifermentans]ETY73567.1 hypothetical protein LFAB_11680 [Lactiplantibacillus fabifermentans T30PCM01]KRO27468.1 hypothetical protein DY78_GL003217 [Lactiplantibacillus fabifermentans DSM 21115]